MFKLKVECSRYNDDIVFVTLAGERSIVAGGQGGVAGAGQHAEAHERHAERRRGRGARRARGGAALAAAGAAAARARHHPQEAQVQVLRHTVGAARRTHSLHTGNTLCAMLRTAYCQPWCLLGAKYFISNMSLCSLKYLYYHRYYLQNIG